MKMGGLWRERESESSRRKGEQKMMGNPWYTCVNEYSPKKPFVCILIKIAIKMAAFHLTVIC